MSDCYRQLTFRKREPVGTRLKVRSKSVVASESMLKLRHAKYATRSSGRSARKDGALFRPTASRLGEPRQRTEAWALDDRGH